MAQTIKVVATIILIILTKSGVRIFKNKFLNEVIQEGEIKEEEIIKAGYKVKHKND